MNTSRNSEGFTSQPSGTTKGENSEPIYRRHLSKNPLVTPSLSCFCASLSEISRISAHPGASRYLPPVRARTSSILRAAALVFLRQNHKRYTPDLEKIPADIPWALRVLPRHLTHPVARVRVRPLQKVFSVSTLRPLFLLSWLPRSHPRTCESHQGLRETLPATCRVPQGYR